LSPSPKILSSLENSLRSISRVFRIKVLRLLSSVSTVCVKLGCICTNRSADFVGNEQETNRLTIDSLITERPLREIYLKPFEIAVREANPWAVMSSYNLINGVHADMNRHTLKDILRGEWGYEG
jgi:hypothetical protein